MAFPDNCSPRIISVDASNDCTLTRASIDAMTPDDFEAQGNEEVGMDKVYARAREAKAAGYKETDLEMLLMGRMSPMPGAISKTSIGPNESVILPYIARRQKHNIQSNYWKITAGTANPSAGSGSTPTHAWDVTVSTHDGTYASTLAEVERYFLPGKYVYVEGLDSSGNALSLQFKILASANASATTATVTLVPNYTESGWSGLTSAQQTDYQPTAGHLVVLANSVSDYESWGANEVAENTNKLLIYWLQTYRESHEWTDEYIKALNAALTSMYFKDFKQLPLAEQRRIQHSKVMKQWVNSIFYGQRINENQTREGYTNLPQVVDPELSSCVIEYKANALGIHTQLNDCGRVIDKVGGALDLQQVFDGGYDLKRAREASGGMIDTLDYMTDRFTAGRILQIMSKFYKAKYGIDHTRYYDVDQKLSFENQVALKHNIFQLPPDVGGFNFAVFNNSFFDDRLASFASGIANRGRILWGIDWSDVEVGIAASSTVQRKTNEADELYKYIMKINSKHVTLSSTTFTTVVEDANRHQIFQNFSNDCPDLAVEACTPA